MYQKITPLNDTVRATIQKIDCSQNQIVPIVCNINGTTLEWIRDARNDSNSREVKTLLILVGILRVKFGMTHHSIGNILGRTQYNSFMLYKRFVALANDENLEPSVYDAFMHTMGKLYEKRENIAHLSASGFSKHDYPRMINYINTRLEPMKEARKLLSVMALLTGQSPREIELNYFVNANDVTEYALEVRKEAQRL